MEKDNTYWQVEGEIRAPRGSTNCLLLNEGITGSWSIDYDLVRISYKRGILSMIIFETFVKCNDRLKATFLAGEKFEQIVEGFNLSGCYCHLQMETPKTVSKDDVDENILIEYIDEKQDNSLISPLNAELELVDGMRRDNIPSISWKDSVRLIELVKKAKSERDKKRLRYLMRAMRLVPIDKAAAYLYAIEIIEDFFNQEFKEIKKNAENSKKSGENFLNNLKKILPGEAQLLDKLKNKLRNVPEYSWEKALNDLCVKTGFYENVVQSKESFKEQLKQIYAFEIPKKGNEELEKEAERLFKGNEEFWETTSKILWNKRNAVAHFRPEIDRVTIELFVCLELSKFLVIKAITGELS